ncbi:hypothetical protein FRACYDRAFT_244962 [Fragilariopsis cylindrus CCMP1102]|uniref:Uncharacterized protein n=1 Tax=Fragilariopsis cylindrus CCMP1102 TaxID=635003 RepID=A0A1E7F0W2_9STRA|nr:hypothetical protein FRACYDRAFT_244962 [Fragilariopsis cylindrus CCMP1102]|eukprot:OEU11842.1 hypothetical protein FRACYDRAFT_244962 [Fragilariopsis cylindrus CCMP1102]
MESNSRNKRIRLDDRAVIAVPTILSVGLPIEEEESAIRKLKKWKFIDDDVTSESDKWYELANSTHSFLYAIKRVPLRPMLVFAYLRDIPMMRYILLKSRDASEVSRCDSTGEYFPMNICTKSSDSCWGVMEVVKWLREQGANISQRFPRPNGYGDGFLGFSIFGSFIKRGYRDDDYVSLWLLREGVLLNEHGEFDRESAMVDLFPNCHGEEINEHTSEPNNNTYRRVKTWAQDIVHDFRSFFVFLTGTLALPLPDECAPKLQNELHRKLSSRAAAERICQKMDQPEDRIELVQEISTPLYIFNGHCGILERIAAFAGIESKEHLRTAKGLIQIYEMKNPYIMKYACRSH